MTHRLTPRVEMLEPRRLLAALGPDQTFASPIGTASADFVGAPLPFLDLPGHGEDVSSAPVNGVRGAGVTVMPDGRVVVAGSAIGLALAGDPRGNLRLPLTASQPVLARFLPDGSPDPSFGAGGRSQAADGRVFLDLPGVPKTEYDVQVTTGRVAADAQGRLLVPTTTAGEQVYRPYEGRSFLYRLDAYGDLDPTFAAGGVYEAGATTVRLPSVPSTFTSDSPAETDYPVGTSLPTVLPDGKILVAGLGSRYNVNSSDGQDGTGAPIFVDTPTVARLNPDGSLDRTFGTNGLAVGIERGDLTPVALLVGADGRIVLVQNEISSTGYDAGTQTNLGPGTDITYDVFDADGTRLGGALFSTLAGFEPKPNPYQDEQISATAVDAALDATDGLLVLANTGRTQEAVVARIADPINAGLNNGGIVADVLAGPLAVEPSAFTPLAGGGLMVVGKLISTSPEQGAPAVLELGPDGQTVRGPTVIRGTPGLPTGTANGLAAADAVALGYDGSVIVAGTGGPNGASLTAARRWRDAGPLGQIQANGPITAANSVGGYRFQVVWRADDGIDVSSLDSSDLVVVSPAGSKRRAAFLGSATLADGRVVANYKIAPPNGLRWTADDAGRHVVRVLNGHVGDLGGDRVDGRYLGEFMVNLPSATRSAVPMGLARPASFPAFSGERIDPADPLDFGPHDEELLR